MFSYVGIGFLILIPGHLLQVVVLDSCFCVFSALSMVLWDPGGESSGSAFPQGSSSK